MGFDVQAALHRALAAENEQSDPLLTANSAKLAKHDPKPAPRLAGLAGLAISNGSNPENRNAPDAALPDLIGQFRERAGILKSEGVPLDRATWMAALDVFVQADERAAWFGPDHALADHVRQVCIATIEGVTVTFHQNGRVSFHRSNMKGADHG